MKRFLSLLFAVGLYAAAQMQPDESAVANLPKAFAEAMTKHDGHELAKIMAGDVDFVTVGAMWLQGRSDFETYHARLLNGRFLGATMAPLQIRVRLLHPNIAVVHWTWRIAGDKNIDGTERRPRYGMMTMVVEKQNGAWLVVAAQNDNATTGVPPEAKGIKMPIPIPEPN